MAIYLYILFLFVSRAFPACHKPEQRLGGMYMFFCIYTSKMDILYGAFYISSHTNLYIEHPVWDTPSEQRILTPIFFFQAFACKVAAKEEAPLMDIPLSEEAIIQESRNHLRGNVSDPAATNAAH